MQPTTQTLTISGKKLAYYDIGDLNAPAILLGHSFLWDKDMWRKQFDALSSDYRLIVPDLWAHGESEGLPAAPTSIKQIADDHCQLMQKLGISRFSIIGLSVGGMWGSQIALDHPDDVDTLIIMGTYVGAEPPESQAAYMGLIGQLKASNSFADELIETTWRYFYSPKVSDDSPLATEIKQRLKNHPTHNIGAIYEIGKAIFTRDSNLEKLAQLEIPFAIITGADDIARVPSESETMAKAANTENLCYIKDAGHISCLEQPEAVNQYLLNFLSHVA